MPDESALLGSLGRRDGAGRGAAAAGGRGRSTRCGLRRYAGGCGWAPGLLAASAALLQELLLLLLLLAVLGMLAGARDRRNGRQAPPG